MVTSGVDWLLTYDLISLSDRHSQSGRQHIVLRRRYQPPRTQPPTYTFLVRESPTSFRDSSSIVHRRPHTHLRRTPLKIVELPTLALYISKARVSSIRHQCSLSSSHQPMTLIGRRRSSHPRHYVPDRCQWLAAFYHFSCNWFPWLSLLPGYYLREKHKT